jgi:hypothetical protein
LPDNDFPYTVITADGTFSGRLTDEDVLEVREMNLEPNYEQTTKFLAEAICQGASEKPYLAMYSVLDQFRYLMQTDKPAAMRIIEHFSIKSKSWEPDASVGGEDAHLEEAYEDRFESDLD